MTGKSSARLTAALLVLFLASGARADLFFPYSSKSECKYIREDDPGYSMEKVPVQDQGASNSCFAFAAAQMADAWRFTNGPRPPFGPQPPAGGYNHITSATRITDHLSAELGYDVNDTTGITAAFWRTPGRALEALKKYGSCSARHLYGDGSGVDNADGTSLAQRDAVLGALDAKYAAYARTTERFDKEQLLKMMDELDVQHPDWTLEHKIAELYFRKARMDGEGQAMCEVLGRYGLSDQLLVEGLGKNAGLVLDALVGTSSTRERFLERYKELVCKRNSVSVNWLPNVNNQLTWGDHAAALRLIHARLNRGKLSQPVGVSICSEVLYTPGHRGFTPNPFNLCSPIPGEKGTETDDKHQTLVIGRQWNEKTGKCQFLIQNTWGGGCLTYRQHTPHWDCVEPGKVWVDEEALTKNTFAVSALGD